MEAKCRDEGKELDESGREDGGKYGERGPAEDKFLGKESKDACGGRGGGDHPAEDKASSGRRSHDVDVAKAGGEDGGRADDGQFPDGLDEAALDALLVREINAVIFHDKSFEHELREYIGRSSGRHLAVAAVPALPLTAIVFGVAHQLTLGRRPLRRGRPRQCGRW